MGGKSYYCDYCDCFMKNDMIVRKNHNLGMLHKIAKANYLQRYRDPKEIIDEERKKIPCKRFLSNKECMFGLFCHYSHYSSEQLSYLEYLCEQNKDTAESRSECLPWKDTKRRRRLSHITPSLQTIDISRISESCLQNQWGESNLLK